MRHAKFTHLKEKDKLIKLTPKKFMFCLFNVIEWSLCKVCDYFYKPHAVSTFITPCKHIQNVPPKVH